MQYIKGRSSRRLQEEFEDLRKRYWGQYLWARGYFCATVGALDEETIKKHIESQHWDDDAEGFKITASTKPEPALQPGTLQAASVASRGSRDRTP